MNLLFTDEAWEEYVYWQETNKSMYLNYSNLAFIGGCDVLG
jgi:Txe/YoeB family toxin of Txe-Axe toxin-antitoxin module